MDITPGRIGHVAINADNMATSRAFYEATFGWTFEPHFGMDDFRRATGPDGAEPGPFLVLKGRRDLDGVQVVGAEANWFDAGGSASALGAPGPAAPRDGRGTRLWPPPATEDPSASAMRSSQPFS